MINIAVAQGDGIGKEIMAASLKVFKSANVPLKYHMVDMGKSVYLQGHSTGMTAAAKSTVEKYGILYKGPMETPKGTGVKSINVTARKVWSTFANKRVFKTLPGVDTVFSKAGIPIDITLVRENIEDTYGGIEHMQTNDVAQCRRLITRPGSEQVHDYAIKMGLKRSARRITCAHKANIMKITDGLFLESFYNVAKRYQSDSQIPDQTVFDDVIVDDLAMKLVAIPDKFDVIVLPNLQGDIISDLCAGLVGGLGMAPSANIGDNISIFEAVHGTAPDIAGQNMANPTALLLSGVMMLRHLQLNDHANRIEKSLTWTLQKGYRTKDLAKEKSDKVLSTSEFADAIIQNLPPEDAKAQVPKVPEWKHPKLPNANNVKASPNRQKDLEKTVGMDIFVDTQLLPSDLADYLKSVCEKAKDCDDVELIMLSNRGTQVWPSGSLFTECINHYRARLQVKNPSGTQTEIESKLLKLASQLSSGDSGKKSVRLCSLEMLLEIDGKKGYSLAQGQ